MITDELARSRDGWRRRADELRALARAARAIEGWDSPAGGLLVTRLAACAEAVDRLGDSADDLAEAYDLHLRVVSVGGRIQL